MPTQRIMHAGLVLSAHVHNNYYELVKVVNIASGTCLAASYPRTEMHSPIESEHEIPSLYLVQRESQWFFG